VTGAVQHHCDVQTHSISSLLDTITHLTPGTQPRQEPRQPDPATYRQTGKPATRQHPAAPGSTWKCPHIVSAWQHPAAPGSTRQQTRQHPAAPGSTRQQTRQQTRQNRHPAAPGNPANTRQHPGNPATRPGNTRQPGNQGSKHVRDARLAASTSG
jgi:hypothetical protein